MYSVAVKRKNRGDLRGNLLRRRVGEQGGPDRLTLAAYEKGTHPKPSKEPDLRTAITYAMEQCTLINQVSEGISAVVVTGSVVTVGESRAIVRSIAGFDE